MPPRATTGIRRRKRRKLHKNGNVLINASNSTVATKPKLARRGKLAQLTNMPLDILYEIFGHLGSYDLLKLSRMAKMLRRVLLNPSSVSVWRNARLNTGLPDCPADMTEPQWANLAFSPHCHFCLTGGARIVEWRFRLRACTRCAKDHLTETLPAFEIRGVPADRLLPTRQAQKRYKLVFANRDRLKLCQELEARTNNQEELSDFLAKQKSYVADLLKHAVACEKWAKTQNQERSMELDRLRLGRKTAIIEKLRALGWGLDVDSMRDPDSLADHKLVKVPQRLTDRIWSNIRVPIIEFMEKMRRKRIEREQIEIIMNRKATALNVLRNYKNKLLPDDKVMPAPVDFCNMEPIKAMINQPLDISINEESFDPIVPQMAELFSLWRKGIHYDLFIRAKSTNRLPFSLFEYDDLDDIYGEQSSESETDEDEDDSSTEAEVMSKLQLATTIFCCRECGLNSLISYFDSPSSRPLFFPEILQHPCLTRQCDFGFPTYAVFDPSKALRDSPRTRTSWNAHALILNRRLKNMAERIVLSSGLDPKVATAADLDAQNLYYACLDCIDISMISVADGMGMTPVFMWREAVRHQAELHDEVTDWHIVDEDEFNENRVQPLENEDDGGDNPLRSLWCCTLCRDTPDEQDPMCLSAIFHHLSSRHEVTDGVLNEDYYKSSYAASKYLTHPPYKMLVSFRSLPPQYF
ncbi:hypothetical protein AMATHDRAFT_5842 [Amanita thiersii Skay4041]|uniref:F-box domain-containing protein n=1 Tax=Amanita thiersii Skay4041 TaxID=703135 RepID=A0A2A9NJI8_9AGAR|nr:hypothetical protein AMATHDRAFT_5842 [Amanita thiersii Skay4041]